MEDEGLRRQEVDRAARAKRILEDDLFVEAIEAIKDEIMRDFANSSLNDDETRKTARLRLKALDDVVGKFKSCIQTGQMASTQLSWLREKMRVIK